MRRILFLALTVICLTLALSLCISAEEYTGPTVTLEPIPEELKLPSDPATLTQFVVISDVRFFSGSGSTLDTLNKDALAKAFEQAGIAVSDLGTKYLTKIVFPAQWADGTPITYANINLSGNGMKTSVYLKNVCGYIEYPAGSVQVNDFNECTAQLRCIDFGENNTVKTIPLSFANYATRLRYLKNFPTELDLIDKEAFANCKNLAMEEIYINATKIEYKAFDNAFINFKRVVFGPRLKTAGDQAFSCDHNAFSNNYVNSEGIIQLESIEFQGDVTKISFCTLGSPHGSFYFIQNSDSQRKSFTKLKCIILSNEANASLDGKTNFEVNPNLSFGDSTRYTYYVHTSHALDEESVSITYADFTKNGVKSGECSRCESTMIESVKPIFVANGYSVDAYGTGLAGGFTVDVKAVADWKKYGGDENVSFGIVIFNPKYLGNGTILDDNNRLTVKSGAVQIDIVSSEYSTINFMIQNFTDELMDLELVIAGYVIADGEAQLVQKEYSLSDTAAVSTVTRADASLYTVTLNTVVARRSVASVPEYVIPSNDEE